MTIDMTAHAELKAGHGAMWAGGDYPLIVESVARFEQENLLALGTKR